MADWNDRLNLVCFEPLQHERSWELETYLKIGGYEAWKKILAEKPPREQVIEAVKAYATLGEMCDALREVWGEYEEPPVF